MNESEKSTEELPESKEIQTHLSISDFAYSLNVHLNFTSSNVVISHTSNLTVIYESGSYEFDTDRFRPNTTLENFRLIGFETAFTELTWT